MRRRPANDLDGVLLVDKPAGLTSHDVVARVRKHFSGSRTGHTGTLDPMATGLLILCLGKATKLSRFLTALDKEYRGAIRLGSATTTFDREGEVTERGSAERVAAVSLDDVRGAALRFVGSIEQVPPPYSAKKVGGRRFYEMARSGEEIPASTKQVDVGELDIESLSEVPAAPAAGEAPAAGKMGRSVRFRMTCSSGTYVRAIAHDLGKVLQVGAHLEELTRTRVGPFDLDAAISLERLLQPATESPASPEDRIALSAPFWLPLERIPLPFPEVIADRVQIGKLGQGQKILVKRETSAGQAGDLFRIVNERSQLIAIGELVHHLGSDASIHVIQPKLVL